MTQYRPLVYWSAFTASVGGFLQSYAACAIAGALLFIHREFGLSVTQEGLAASIILLGALAGSLLTGYLADGMGRRRTLMLAALLFILSALPVLFIESFLLLLLLRFIAGVAAGITSLVVPLYLAEIAPSKLRGAFVASFQLAVTVGTLAAYLINLQGAEKGDWRFMLFFTAIPAIFQLIALFFIPESPKWLFGSGQAAKGVAVARSLHDEDPFLPREKEELAASSWKALFSPFFRKGIFIGVSLVVLQQWVGINAIVYYAPKIFLHAGFTEAKGAIQITLGLGAVNFFATLFSLFLIDRLGRRTLLLISQGWVGLSLVLFTFTFFVSGHSMLAVLALVIYMFAYAVGLGPIPWVIVSEIYPLAIRARGIALMTFLSWLSNFLVVFTFPHLNALLGPSWTFAAYTAIALASFWLFRSLIPETKGKSLEEIEQVLYQ